MASILIPPLKVFLLTKTQMKIVVESLEVHIKRLRKKLKIQNQQNSILINKKTKKIY